MYRDVYVFFIYIYNMAFGGRGGVCSWRDPVSRSVYVIMAVQSFIALTGTPDKSSSSGARTKTMLLIHFTGFQCSRAQTSIPLSASVMSHLGKLVVNMRGGGRGGRWKTRSLSRQRDGGRKNHWRKSSGSGSKCTQEHPHISHIQANPDIIQIHNMHVNTPKCLLDTSRHI